MADSLSDRNAQDPRLVDIDEFVHAYRNPAAGTDCLR